MSDLAIDQLSRWLIDYYSLVTVLLSIVLLTAAVMRQPARRIGLCWAATCGLLGLAAGLLVNRSAPLVVPVFEMPPVSTASDAERLPISQPRESPALPAPGRVMISRPGANEPLTQSQRGMAVVRPVLVYCFLLTGAAMLGWQVLGAVATAILISRARPVSPAIQAVCDRIWSQHRRTPQVLVTADINQALAAGLIKPVILLPQRFAMQESRSSLQAVIAHEAAHIRNADLMLRALQRNLQLLLFAHPLYWLFRAMTQANQEYLADASARGQQPVDYAEILLHWFRTGAAGRNRTFTVSVGLWERPHLLKRRIAMVLNENFVVERTCPVRYRVAIWSTVLAGIAVLSCVTFHDGTVVLAQENSAPAADKAEDKAAPAEKTPAPEAQPTVTPIEVVKKDDLPKFPEAQVKKAKSKYTSADAAYGVGAALYNNRDYAGAREPLEAALIMAPDDDFRIRVYRALLAPYRQLGTIEPFVGACEYIIRHSDRDAEQSLTRRTLLSFVHERGKVDAFIKRHEERLKKNPKDRLSVYVLSEVYSDVRENPARSIELLKQLAELDGKDAGEAINVNDLAKLATQHIRAKEYQKGAELYEKIAPQDKKLEAWHWKEAATAWLKLKQYDKAVAAAKKSAEAEPEKRSELLTHYWHRHLGDVFLSTGEAKLAIPQFEKAIESTKIEGYIKDCKASLEEAKKKAG